MRLKRATPDFFLNSKLVTIQPFMRACEFHHIIQCKGVIPNHREKQLRID